MKTKLFILSLISSFLVFAPVAKASPAEKNPLFPTYEEVAMWFDTALEGLNTALEELRTDITTLVTRIGILETTVAELPGYQSDIDELELDGSVDRVDINYLLAENLDLKARVSDLETNSKPTPIEIIVFSPGAYTNGSESSVIDTAGYDLITLYGKWEVGTGGYQVYYSEDGVTWTFQDNLASNSNNPPEQRTWVTKGRYYKVVIANSFTAYSWAILH